MSLKKTETKLRWCEYFSKIRLFEIIRWIFSPTQQKNCAHQTAHFYSVMMTKLKIEFIWCHHFSFWLFTWSTPTRIPTVKLKIPEKCIFEIRILNFCYIQIIVFDLGYLLGSRRWNWKFRENFFLKSIPELLLHSSYSFWP